MLRRIPVDRTVTASSSSTTSTPISDSFALMLSTCFGITDVTFTQPPVAAAATM